MEEKKINEVKETKEEKFLRLSSSRVNNVINAIYVLTNMANRSNYSYTEEQVENMFCAIEAVLHVAKKKFIPDDSSRMEFKW